MFSYVPLFKFDNMNISEGSFMICRMAKLRRYHTRSLFIAKQEKQHTIGETLIKPCMLVAAQLVLNNASTKKLTDKFV